MQNVRLNMFYSPLDKELNLLVKHLIIIEIEFLGPSVDHALFPESFFAEQSIFSQESVMCLYYINTPHFTSISPICMLCA